MNGQATPASGIVKVAQAQGRVSVQADCTVDEALVLMQARADATGHSLIEIADAVAAHDIWFN